MRHQSSKACRRSSWRRKESFGTLHFLTFCGGAEQLGEAGATHGNGQVRCLILTDPFEKNLNMTRRHTDSSNLNLLKSTFRPQMVHLDGVLAKFGPLPPPMPQLRPVSAVFLPTRRDTSLIDFFVPPSPLSTSS